MTMAKRFPRGEVVVASLLACATSLLPLEVRADQASQNQSKQIERANTATQEAIEREDLLPPDAEDDALLTSKDALFGTAMPEKADPKSLKTTNGFSRFRGFVLFNPAYTYASPSHWSRGVVRNQVEALGEVNASLHWKASLRVDVDPVYMTSEFYPDPVREDQRFEVLIRETYVDTNAGDWEFRLGRQNIVWGEVVGLFFADVVSARDLRDFILPDFQTIRIPQWAVRGEYFHGDAHLELVWVPIATYDEIGNPGAEFYPFPPQSIPGFSTTIRSEDLPARVVRNSNYGIRASVLRNGWDMSAFFYGSRASFPTFYRAITLSPLPTLEFTPRHDRIWQLGGTLSKDFGGTVMRAEAIYTANKGYEVTRLSEPDGVVKQDTLDYIVSFDLTPFEEGRLNVQAFQRVFFSHDEGILFERLETGISLLISTKVTPRWEPELLIIQSLNRGDRMVRPRINWYPQQNLRISVGVDVFDGDRFGEFGRFANRDRFYAEARYSF
ncbi:MAG TPA: DUF1302 family protein [Burkholderiales bacterium]|nr:DUF1302 family protein [Burkholderiales bacterium]